MRSLLDNVVPLIGLRIWFTGTSKCPLFIAFFTASVKDEADWFDSFCIPLVFDKTLELVEDIVWDLDVEPDETRSANGVHRRFATAVDVVDVERTGTRKTSQIQ